MVRKSRRRFHQARQDGTGRARNTTAQRMVDYLADRGIEIRLVTFSGYVHGDGLLFARQVRTADAPRRPPTVNGLDVRRKASENGVAQLWEDAKDSLDYSVRTYYKRSGITYLQKTITLPDSVRVRGSHSLTIVGRGTIRITFYPGAVDVCYDRFDELKKAIDFESEKPPNTPATRRVPEQWYCRLDEESWYRHKAALIEFVRAMEDAWRNHEHLGSKEAEQS